MILYFSGLPIYKKKTAFYSGLFVIAEIYCRKCLFASVAEEGFTFKKSFGTSFAGRIFTSFLFVFIIRAERHQHGENLRKIKRKESHDEFAVAIRAVHINTSVLHLELFTENVFIFVKYRSAGSAGSAGAGF